MTTDPDPSNPPTDPYTPPADPSPPPPVARQPVRILRAPWKTRAQNIALRILRPVTLVTSIAVLLIIASYYIRHIPVPPFSLITASMFGLLNLPLSLIQAAARDDQSLASRAQDWITGPAHAAGWAWRRVEGREWLKGSLYLGRDGELGFQAKSWGRPDGTRMMRDRIVAFRIDPAGILEVTLANGHVEQFRTGCAELWRQAFEETRSGMPAQRPA